MDKKPYFAPRILITEVKMERCIAGSQSMGMSNTVVESDDNVYSRSTGVWDDDD